MQNKRNVGTNLHVTYVPLPNLELHSFVLSITFILTDANVQKHLHEMNKMYYVLLGFKLSDFFFIFLPAGCSSWLIKNLNLSVSCNFLCLDLYIVGERKGTHK